MSNIAHVPPEGVSHPPINAVPAPIQPPVYNPTLSQQLLLPMPLSVIAFPPVSPPNPVYYPAVQPHLPPASMEPTVLNSPKNLYDALLIYQLELKKGLDATQKAIDKLRGILYVDASQQPSNKAETVPVTTREPSTVQPLMPPASEKPRELNEVANSAVHHQQQTAEMRSDIDVPALLERFKVKFRESFDRIDGLKVHVSSQNKTYHLVKRHRLYYSSNRFSLKHSVKPKR